MKHFIQTIEFFINYQFLFQISMELPLQDSEVERFLKVNESKDIFEKFGETDTKIEIEIAGNLYLIPRL